MIFACPACSTRYVVPDSAIGLDGRTVRCAKCRHSWFQDGHSLPARADPNSSDQDTAVPPVQTRPISAPQQHPDGPAADANASNIATVPEPPAVARRTARKGADAFSEAPSSFEHEPPFRPRRNTGKLWTMAAMAFAISVAGLIGLAAVFGVPDWLPIARATFASAPRDLELSFPPERQDRRTLPNKSEYFGASGTVTNIGKDIREVPPILIVLRDDKNRIVYTWDVSPPQQRLRPGESVTINEAVTDVPKSASFAEIGWKPD